MFFSAMITHVPKRASEFKAAGESSARRAGGSDPSAAAWTQQVEPACDGVFRGRAVVLRYPNQLLH